MIERPTTKGAQPPSPESTTAGKAAFVLAMLLLGLPLLAVGILFSWGVLLIPFAVLALIVVAIPWVALNYWIWGQHLMQYRDPSEEERSKVSK